MLPSLTLIFGKTLTGKTARMLFELSQEPRVILVDGKCAGLVELDDYRHFWPEYVRDQNRWRYALDALTFLREVVDGAKSFRAAFHFRMYHRENFELLCRLLPHVRSLVLAVDECSLFIPTGGPGSLPPWTTAVLVSGTHDGIRVVGTAQRPVFVHPSARANAAKLLIYRVQYEDDIDALAPYLCGLPWGLVRSLEDYVCIEWTDGGVPLVDHSFVGRLVDVLPARPIPAS